MPIPYKFKVSTPSLFLEQNLYVCDLIDESFVSRKDDIVAGIFNAQDCELILKIPLSFLLMDDQQVWHYTSNGEFIIYYAFGISSRTSVFMRKNSRDVATSSKDIHFWPILWGLKIPSKGMLFM